MSAATSTWRSWVALSVLVMSVLQTQFVGSSGADPDKLNGPGWFGCVVILRIAREKTRINSWSTNHVIAHHRYSSASW